MTSPQFANLDFSTAAFLVDGDPAEVFIVLKVLNNSNAVGWGQFGKSASSRYTTSNVIREGFAYNTSNYSAVTKYDGSAAFAIYNVSAETGSHIMRADYPDGGAEPGLVTIRTTSLVTPSGSTEWRVGTFLLFKQGVTPWWGSIGEVLVYDHVLTDPDRTTVYNYLQGRWAVS